MFAVLVCVIEFCVWFRLFVRFSFWDWVCFALFFIAIYAGVFYCLDYC